MAADEDGGLALVPSHWVISSSAIGPAFGGPWAGAGRTGSGLVASPPGASSCLVAAPERSAVTAARMRCRRSSESTGEEAAPGGRPGPGRAPDALRQFPAGLLVCHAGHTPCAVRI